MRGLPAGNDGRLMAIVLSIMRFCVLITLEIMYLLIVFVSLLSMILFSQLYYKLYRLLTTLSKCQLILKCSHNLHLIGIHILHDL
uniref:Uncharacterized protein n=1 Tax=Solanum tuberosum TaxID=4113 RepID=M1D6B7_SOLTU